MTDLGDASNFHLAKSSQVSATHAANATGHDHALGQVVNPYAATKGSHTVQHRSNVRGAAHCAASKNKTAGGYPRRGAADSRGPH
eukprot:8174328-Pyramimonas_sp.AAC.1